MPRERRWNIIVVEDEATIRGQLKEYLDGEEIAGGKLTVFDYPDFTSAQQLLRDRKADLVVLDLFLGAPAAQHAEGLAVLEEVKATGFLPFVIYTAKPEAVTDLVSPFVRLVGKADGGLAKLKEEIEGLFRLRIPQIHRGIAEHLDRSLAQYMWTFVVPHWDELGPLADKPEFVRLLLQRLAASLIRFGLEDLAADVFGVGSAIELAHPDKVHPAEMYVKPPVGPDPLLGDIRIRRRDGKEDYLVVLWPSCDMVSSRDGQPVATKTTHALSARAVKVVDTPEHRDWVLTRSNNAQGRVRKLFKSDRYYLLPAAWDIPDLLVDFQTLEHIPLDDLRAMPPVATLASPYAESLGSRFIRHLGRLGTPDLDIELVEKRLFPVP